MSEPSPFVVKTAATYTGDLKCTAVHVQSRSSLSTAAPVDNQGDGSSFSPTDLVGVSLATCMLTTMAMAARRDDVDLEGASIEVEKQMSPDLPRRIARLRCAIRLPATVPADAVDKLRRVAEGCPVHRSLHPDVNVELTVETPNP